MSEEVTGEVVKVVERTQMLGGGMYEEFWAKEGETYKVVRVDE